MSNRPDETEEDDIPETDFSGAVRGKYYERAMRGTNVVLLEPDVAKVFHDSAVVSQGLREYLAEHGAPPVVPKRELTREPAGWKPAGRPTGCRRYRRSRCATSASSNDSAGRSVIAARCSARRPRANTTGVAARTISGVV